MSTKKYSHNLKVELFYLVKMFRVPSLGDSMSVALRKLLQGRRRGSQATNKFVTKGAANLNIEDQSRGPPGEITWAPRGNHVGPQGKSRGPPGAIKIGRAHV